MKDGALTGTFAGIIFEVVSGGGSKGLRRSVVTWKSYWASLVGAMGATAAEQAMRLSRSSTSMMRPAGA